jgi:uncharacterized protein YfkK (UPF0435 family)
MKGLADLRAQRIPSECIIDMSNDIIVKLQLLNQIEKIMADKQDLHDYTIMRAIYNLLKKIDYADAV